MATTVSVHITVRRDYKGWLSSLVYNTGDGETMSQSLKTAFVDRQDAIDHAREYALLYTPSQVGLPVKFVGKHFETVGA